MEIEQQATKEKRSIFSVEVEELLERERNARQNNLHQQSIDLLQEIIQLAFDDKKYDDLCELVGILAKKRGQAVKAQIGMVRLAMTFIEKIDTEETKLKFIKAMKNVTEKKIYLEVEYARCCMMLVKKQETDENIDEAARILQDVQVETYGSMDAREKLEFILYQMKIMIKKDDMIRLLIVSRKINKKSFKPENVEDLKVIYYTYMHILHSYEHGYLDLANDYKHILDTLNTNKESLKNLKEKTEFGFGFDKAELFAHLIFYAVQSKFSEEKMTLLNELDQNYTEYFDKNQGLKKLIKGVLSKELISCDITTYGATNYSLYKEGDAHCEEHKTHLKKQLIQHNIQVSSKYYKQAHLKRLAQLFGVTKKEVELELCETINEGLIKGKIDRLDGIIKFKLKRTDNEVLDEWVKDVNQLMNLVDATCNIIHREEENYKK